MATTDRVSRAFELPLFRRELAEQAQRKRTYVLRCTCMAVFTLIFMTAYIAFISQDVPVMRLLGSGRRIFAILMMSMMAAVLLLTPAISCSAISLEKEKQTLGLLMISRLSPRSIIIEKLLSRMMPMLTLLLAATPLFAVTYLLGGVQLSQILLGGWVLLMAVVQITAIALLCSAVLDSGLAAFWGTYILMGKLFFLWPILVELRLLDPPETPRWFAAVNSLPGFVGIVPSSFDPSLPSPEFLFFPGYQMATMVEHAASPEEYALLMIPSLLLTVVLLVAARFGLTRFAFDSLNSLKAPLLDRITFVLQPLRELAGRARRADFRLPHFVTKFQAAAAARHTSSIADQIDASPLAWRESRASVVARPRMILFLSALFVLLPAAILQSGSPPGTDDFCALLGFSAQIIGLLLVVGLSSKMFARERERQTLDTLLATPLSNRELLIGKLGVINRLIVRLLIPILLAGLWNVLYSRVRPLSYFESPLTGRFFRYNRSSLSVADGQWWISAGFYFTCLISHAFVFMHLVKWISVLIGLRQRSLIRTLVASLVTLLGLCLVPLLLFVAGSLLSGTNPDDSFLFFLSSPLIVVAFNEYHDFIPLIRHLDGVPFAEVVLMLCTLTLYGGLALFLRSLTYANLGILMQRADAETKRHLLTAGQRKSRTAL